MTKANGVCVCRAAAAAAACHFHTKTEWLCNQPNEWGVGSYVDFYVYVIVMKYTI